MTADATDRLSLELSQGSIADADVGSVGRQAHYQEGRLQHETVEFPEDKATRVVERDEAYINANERRQRGLVRKRKSFQALIVPGPDKA